MDIIVYLGQDTQKITFVASFSCVRKALSKK